MDETRSSNEWRSRERLVTLKQGKIAREKRIFSRAASERASEREYADCYQRKSETGQRTGETERDITGGFRKKAKAMEKLRRDDSEPKISREPVE